MDNPNQNWPLSHGKIYQAVVVKHMVLVATRIDLCRKWFTTLNSRIIWFTIFDNNAKSYDYLSHWRLQYNIGSCLVPIKECIFHPPHKSLS